MIPIEPRGAKDRKWVCTECATDEEKNNVDKDLRELSNTIAGEKVF